jgi:hypothetical protein
MRVRMSVAVLAAAALLAVGCGSATAPPAGGSAPTAAAAGTPATSRISVTMVIHSHGGLGTFTSVGEFDYAHARGEFRMTTGGSAAEQEVFVRGHLYLKLPGGGQGLPGGKTWLVVSAASPDGLPFPAPASVPVSNPAGLLSSLTATATRVQDLGPATVRGIPVTHFRLTLDPAKAASLGHGHGPADLRPIFAVPGMSPPRVDVWTDGQRVARRATLAVPSLPGAPPSAGAFRLTETVDYYDFGVPVRVSPPPAGEVFGGSVYSGSPAYGSKLTVTFDSSISIATGGSNGGGFFSSTAPPVSGTLTAAQAASAEQAVRSFWAALGRNDMRAAGRAVAPTQRGCFLLALSHAAFRVSALRIMSAKPAGTARATVWFTVSARIKIGGNSGPELLPGQNGASWLAVISSGGTWFVDLRDSGAAAMDFSPPCR